jgi:hypothetical protein
VDTIRFTVHRTAAAATCPSCHRRSRQVHSQYERHLRDEPLGGRCVAITWRVRRFRCANRCCSRRTFVEQAPQLASPYARHSAPLRATWQHIGLALGGRAGERLCHRLHRPTSRMTLLRLLAVLPLPTPATPRVLGVDDCALRAYFGDVERPFRTTPNARFDSAELPLEELSRRGHRFRQGYAADHAGSNGVALAEVSRTVPS